MWERKYNYFKYDEENNKTKLCLRQTIVHENSNFVYMVRLRQHRKEYRH